MSTTADIETYQRECIEIVVEDIDAEFCRVAADVSFWATRFSEAWEAAQLAEQEYDRLWAAAFLNAKDESGKSLAVEKAKAYAELDLDARAAKTTHIEAEREKIRVKGVLDAVCSKRDMLQSLGASKRSERTLRMYAGRDDSTRTGKEASSGPDTNWGEEESWG